MLQLKNLKHNTSLACNIDNYSLEDIININEYTKTLADRCRIYRNSRKVVALSIRHSTSQLNTIHYPTLDAVSSIPGHHI